MFARTKRLLLRPIWAEDALPLFTAINDEGIVCNLASAPWPYTRDDAANFAARPQDPRLPHFLLTLPGDDGQRLVGSVGLSPNDGPDDGPSESDDSDTPELGYWIARQYWGNGYAAEAGRYIIDIAKMLGHTRLTASHFIDNPASGRVLHKIGFTPTGRIIKRYSAGRGAEAQLVEFALELTDGHDLGGNDLGGGQGGNTGDSGDDSHKIAA